MRAVLQRVSKASVHVVDVGGEELVGSIDKGWLVLVGVANTDSDADAVWLAEKTLSIRAFADADGKMNMSVMEVGGSVLAVSQFTLMGDTRKGRRPGFSDAADPTTANTLYEKFVAALRAGGASVATGRFQAHMRVTLENDGPVTLLLDSKKVF